MARPREEPLNFTELKEFKPEVYTLLQTVALMRKEGFTTTEIACAVRRSPRQVYRIIAELKQQQLMEKGTLADTKLSNIHNIINPQMEQKSKKTSIGGHK